MLESERRFWRFFAVRRYQEDEVNTRADDEVSAEELRRYAFHMEPKVEVGGESWTASYPEATWSVSGRSREEALQQRVKGAALLPSRSIPRRPTMHWSPPGRSGR